MKKLLNVFLSGAMAFILCARCTNEKLIPVTTASEKAKTLYTEALAAYDDIYFDRFVNLMIQALKEDPDFFMANYQMAMYSLYFKDPVLFMEYGKRATQDKAILSPGEIIMKDALKQLLKKSDSDVTAFGESLVKKYPYDITSYNQLYFYQEIIKDLAGQEETLNKALEVATNKAPVYNRLGYLYMNLGRNDEALAAFEKYVELEPSLPNPYDSKGDFFMFTRDFRKAYDNYMKANAIDSTWSLTKAMNAKTIADSLGI